MMLEVHIIDLIPLFQSIPLYTNCYLIIIFLSCPNSNRTQNLFEKLGRLWLDSQGWLHAKDIHRNTNRFTESNGVSPKTYLPDVADSYSAPARAGPDDTRGSCPPARRLWVRCHRSWTSDSCCDGGRDGTAGSCGSWQPRWKSHTF